MIQPILWSGVAAIMIAIIWFDLRQLRIPNALSLLLVAIFAASQIAGGTAPDIWLRLAVALAVFAAGFAGFVLRAIGGGDVKVLTAGVLLVPVAHLSEVMLVFAATLLTGTLLVLAARKMVAHPENSWAFLGSARMPMGLPIGAAGILSLLLIGLGQ